MKTLKFLCVYSILVVTAFQTFSQTTGEKPNFIFIIVDDLNDYVEPLGGHPQVKTPHITQLAQNGYVFNNAFCSTPVCAPSRTSILSGKTTQYTQIYSNDQYLPEFRDNFTAANGNEEVITLPEHLKNNGYYTYGIGKIFHSAYNKDFDDSNPDPCEKELSWSKVIVPNTANSLEDSFDLMTEGVEKFVWSRIDSSYEKKLKDYKSIDSAIVFLQEVNDGSLPVCEENFFLAIGMSLPHLNLHVPEQYFNEHYLVDIYEEPFNKPYNDPYNAFPYNGIVMPPQPEVRWDDYDALGVLGKDVALGQGDIETSILNYRLGLSYLPEIDPLLSIEGRNYIIEESKRANALMAYIAGVQFMDAQVGRLLETLNTMPTLAENTIIIFVSDNGFSLGEKHHWLKRSFWETDIRVPLIVYDPSLPATIYCNQTLSMLDLYPTICDIAGITHPLFSDESKYLDGQSFFPVLNDPLIKWSKPATISWEAEPPRDCSCYPQFAVRSDKFSYIKYQSDGSDPVHDCIESESFFEEELYEVGEKR
ncbi:MAG: sulfatase-like hydrolase/transferase, partial [Chitinophagales bacterium]